MTLNKQRDTNKLQLKIYAELKPKEVSLGGILHKDIFYEQYY